MTSTVYTAAQGIGAPVVARALVTPVPFSARYDLDRETGVISRSGHPLKGESIAGKILVAASVQGGVAAGWAMLALRSRDLGFAGMVFGDTNPVMVQGAIAAGHPILAGVDTQLLSAVRNGDFLRLDPQARTVEILDRPVQHLAHAEPPGAIVPGSGGQPT